MIQIYHEILKRMAESGAGVCLSVFMMLDVKTV
jgi:hypothetical protein